MDKQRTSARIEGATDSGGQRLPGRVAAIILFSALGAMLTATVLEVQAGATAYIVGESHWSKAQQIAISSLYRYVSHGDDEDLQSAREALKVPLGDRKARLALDRQPIDYPAAEQGFLEGGNAPPDISRMIRMYRVFAHAPFFRDAVQRWRQSDEGILSLVALADHLEQRHLAGALEEPDIGHYQRLLLETDDRLRASEVAFSQSLVDGSRFLRMGLMILSVVAFFALAWYALAVMRRTLVHIRRTESEFRAAFHQAAVGMLKLDGEGRFTQANEALAQILSWPLAELRRQRLADILHAEDLHFDLHGRIDWRRMIEPGERRLRRSDGSSRWVRWSASIINNPDTEGSRIFAVVEDVSEARELASEIAHQASHDDLTGLINRREIERRLGQISAAVQRDHGHHSLCFVDLDQLKLVNDTCGHAAGDRFLRQFASALGSTLRGEDWVGRLGGDEFAIFLANADLDAAEKVSQRIHARLAQSAFHWNDRKFGLGCSIGIVEINADTTDADWLLRAADTACYLAKEEGRNRIRCYRETDEAFARRQTELDWVAHIQLAIAEDRLLLYAQRIKPLRGEPRLQYEVLVRMVDHEGRIYSPGYFLPPLERYGQAMILDRHVLASTLAQLSRDTRHLLCLDLCHINVSAQSIADPQFRRFAADQLDAHPGVANKICFEITETAVIGNLDDACLFIEAMRARGCRIALDDFGSGLSSFAYLKSLDVDILKIDGAFIRDLGKDNVDLALVRSMSQVGRALGKRTIAEWVENEAALAKLDEVGIDCVQGYAIHAPAPLATLIREWKALHLDVLTPAVAVAPGPAALLSE